MGKICFVAIFLCFALIPTGLANWFLTSDCPSPYNACYPWYEGTQGGCIDFNDAPEYTFPGIKIFGTTSSKSLSLDDNTQGWIHYACTQSLCVMCDEDDLFCDDPNVDCYDDEFSVYWSGQKVVVNFSPKQSNGGGWRHVLVKFNYYAVPDYGGEIEMEEAVICVSARAGLGGQPPVIPQ